MVGGRSTIASVCSSLFVLLVCWAIHLQFVASGEEGSDLLQFRSLPGLVNPSNQEVHSGVDGCGNVMPAIGRFGLIGLLGYYFEGEGPALVIQNDNCLINATAESNCGQANAPKYSHSQCYNLGRANAPETPHSSTYNLGWENAPERPHSNSDPAFTILLLVIFSIPVGMIFYECYRLWRNPPRQMMHCNGVLH